MKIIPYESSKHEAMLIKWYNQWNISSDNINILSDCGLIIEDVCAVFLYKTNSSLCLIENLICNKDLTKQIHDQGLDLMCDAILQLAKQSGFKQVISLVSCNPKLAERMIKLGYTISGGKVNIMMRKF